MSVISVVIPALNDAVMLARCLEALAAQTRKADEIIVVDNGSTDDTADIARAGGALVILEPKRGIPAATAAGFDAATGDVIARLDADSIPAPDWVERIEADFARDQGLAAVTGPGEFYGANRFTRRAGEVLYIGGMFWSMGWLLGHPPLFGSNFAIRSGTWARIRDTCHRDVRKLHDDLDMSFQFTPGMRIERDDRLHVGISARPFHSIAGLGRRVYWVSTTLAANSRDGSLLRRRSEYLAWMREQERSAKSARLGRREPTFVGDDADFGTDFGTELGTDLSPE
jgi:glycosyltransferase involved in cell wall biosynthesis